MPDALAAYTGGTQCALRARSCFQVWSVWCWLRVCRWCPARLRPWCLPDLGVFVGGPAKAKFGDVVVAHSDGTGRKVVHKGTLKQAPWYADLAPVTNRIVEIYGDGSKEVSLSNLAVMNVDGSGFRRLPAGPSRLTSTWLAGTPQAPSCSSRSAPPTTTPTSSVLDLTAAHPKLVRLKGSAGLTDASFAHGSDGTVVATDESGAIVTLTGGKTTLVLDPPSNGYLDYPVFAPGDATILFTDFNFAGDVRDRADPDRLR